MKKTMKRFWVVLLGIMGGIILMLVLNIATCPSQKPVDSFLKCVSELRKDKSYSIIVSKENLQTFSSKTRENVLLNLRSKFKKVIIMNEYEIYALKKTEKVKDKIIFECSFKSSFLQYSFRVGYRCGKRSGHIIGEKYYWLFGWHLFEEKNVNL